MNRFFGDKEEAQNYYEGKLTESSRKFRDLYFGLTEKLREENIHPEKFNQHLNSILTDVDREMVNYDQLLNDARNYGLNTEGFPNLYKTILRN